MGTPPVSKQAETTVVRALPPEQQQAYVDKVVSCVLASSHKDVLQEVSDAFVSGDLKIAMSSADAAQSLYRHLMFFQKHWNTVPRNDAVRACEFDSANKDVTARPEHAWRLEVVDQELSRLDLSPPATTEAAAGDDAATRHAVSVQGLQRISQRIEKLQRHFETTDDLMVAVTQETDAVGAMEKILRVRKLLDVIHKHYGGLGEFHTDRIAAEKWLAVREEQLLKLCDGLRRFVQRP